ncbi:MAG TPA: cytochrome c biogenesis protein CcdA [Blastocatellia bacterium]|nr:cytochrome c biogenesis protein CcdA [Blastocatellia bacterium]
MMRKIFFGRVGLALVILLSAVFIATAQTGGVRGSAGVVKAQGVVSTDAIRPGDQFKIAVALDIAEGYHVQGHQPSAGLIATEVNFEPVAGLTIKAPTYPAPKYLKLESLGLGDEELAVHDGTIYVTADAEADRSLKPGPLEIRARYTVQACNDRVCLAPDTVDLSIPVKVVAATEAAKPANAELFAKAAAQPALDATAIRPATGELTQFGGGSRSSLFDKGIFTILIGVFLAGLALNLTPCVYPIIPITIGFFVNQGAAAGKPRLSRTFAMASMYVIGMAITYSILGVIAAKSGGLFGAALQNPVVLVALACVMVALSLSMFGLYEIRVPDALNRFANTSAQSTSGLIGALVMGLTMGIVAAPCIGPFVLALLVEVGARGSAAYGFLLFFVLALGLGFPYLILGTFSGAIKALPRSGLWMVTVRKVFGLVLIGMALYFLMSLMGRWTNLVFVAFFTISALYLIFYESGRAKPAQFAWLLRAVGIGAAAVAIWLILPKHVEAEIEWQPYSEAAVAAAQREGRGVIIDAYATWCIPCKELDQATFTDPTVKREAERFVTLKLDLTSPPAGSEAARARDKFGIRGVPTVIFIDAAGRERDDLRLEGFEKPPLFLGRMKQVPTGQPATAQIAKARADDKVPLSDAAADGGGGALPSLSLSLLNSGALNTEALRGKVTVINFWATWCVPCKAEIPMFNQFVKDYQARGLEIVGISLDEEGAPKVRPFVKANAMSYTVALGDKQTAAAFNVDDSQLPVTLIADKQGRIRYRHLGLPKSKDEFESKITELLNE